MSDACNLPVDLDYLYNAADRMYAQFARSCGLSSCAYWMLYELERAGGEASLRALNLDWSYSKQTMSSALKTIEARGLIALSFEEGSRKSKRAALTPQGRAFVDENIVPAMRAEERAFYSLDQGERDLLLALVRRYTEALNREFEAMNSSRDARAAGAVAAAGEAAGAAAAAGEATGTAAAAGEADGVAVTANAIHGEGNA